ncbi:hypothetical protein HRG_004403 [Hirsutella rhossiliensis]|uniref:Uncharacterized protein n=1 Tax=Hirsutella rhossiliensis TaxID=111463 RepID=A0A9P8MZ84_9HYPO|nr:uncharacterized protein HRG_04403 [Hirsutella rhossiliensis]KAH0963975.1 hypothetical protein HRG_04403 [Hirsutella rhossiliensis]
MSYRLLDLDFSDGGALAQASMDAFYDDPMQQSLFPGMTKEERVKGVISRWPSNYASLDKHWTKVVDVKSGDIVSFASWVFAYTDVVGSLKKVPGKTASIFPLLSCTTNRARQSV